MNMENVVICKNKSGDICSMGVPIESKLIVNDVFFLNKKKKNNSLNNKESTRIFRKNLGVPLPLFLIKNKASNILNIDNSLDIKKNNCDEIIESFVDDDLFEKLLRLAENPTNKKLKTKKNRLKKNRKTRKIR